MKFISIFLLNTNLTKIFRLFSYRKFKELSNDIIFLFIAIIISLIRVNIDLFISKITLDFNVLFAKTAAKLLR
jgi:hypothetical protein